MYTLQQNSYTNETLEEKIISDIKITGEEADEQITSTIVRLELTIEGSEVGRKLLYRTMAHFNCLNACTKMCCECTVLLCIFATSYIVSYSKPHIINSKHTIFKINE